MSASVAVPRSRLAAAHSLSGGADRIDDEQLDKIAEGQLAKIRQAVAHLIGASDPSAVRVDWYHDTAGEKASVQAQPAGWLVRVWPLAIAGVGFCWFLGAAALVRR